MHVQTITNDLKTGKFWPMYKVVKSPGDEHCLLHSVTNAYNAVTATASACIDIDILSTKLKDETIMNAERYIDFIEGNGLPSLISGLNDYIYNKRYDSSYGYLVPVILANVLAIKLLIVTRNMNMYDVLLIESECTVGDHKGTVIRGVTMHRCIDASRYMAPRYAYRIATQISRYFRRYNMRLNRDISAHVSRYKCRYIAIHKSTIKQC